MISGVLSLTWVFVNMVSIQGTQRFVQEPTDTDVLRRGIALLRCQVIDQKGPVQWSGQLNGRDSIYYGTSRNISDRMRMIGSPALGEYHLEIRDATIEDDGIYQCHMQGVGNDLAKNSRTARLTVLVKPKLPTITNHAPKISAKVDEQEIVECVSKDGRPAPNLRWVVAKNVQGTQVVRNLSDTIENVTERNGLFTRKSRLRYVASKSDAKGFLVCIVEHRAIHNESLTTSSELQIQYPPEAKIRTNFTVAKPREGSTIMLICDVIGGMPMTPGSIQYTWTQDGKIVGHSKHLVRRNITKEEYNGKVFTCRASNIAGFSEDSFRLHMRYAPRVRAIGEQIHKPDAGVNVTFKCAVQSDPPAQIRWEKVGSLEAFHPGNELRLARVDSSKTGKYLCIAANSEFQPSNVSFSLIVNGPPHVEMTNQIKGRNGDDVRIECVMRGHPVPPAPKWFKRHSCDEEDSWMPLKAIIHQDKHKRYKFYKFLEQPDHMTSVAYVEISNINPADHGCYMCHVSTRLGNDSATTELTEPEGLPLYFVIPGVVAGGALLLAFCICFICLNRKYLCNSTKSSHREEQESEVDVKVEPMDGGPGVHRYYPDMYPSTDVMEPPEYTGKEYILIPSEQDIDNLPPPYPLPTTNYFTGGTMPPITTFSSAGSTPNGAAVNGGVRNLVQSTYLDDFTHSPLIRPGNNSIGYANGSVVNGGVGHGMNSMYPHSLSEYAMQPPPDLITSRDLLGTYPYNRSTTAGLVDMYKTASYSADPVYAADGGIGSGNGGTLPRMNPHYQPIKTHHSPVLPNPYHHHLNQSVSPHLLRQAQSETRMIPTPPPTGITTVVTTTAYGGLHVQPLGTLETVKEVPTPELEFANNDPRCISQISTHV